MYVHVCVSKIALNSVSVFFDRFRKSANGVLLLRSDAIEPLLLREAGNAHTVE